MPQHCSDKVAQACITADLKAAEGALDQALIRQSRLLTTLLDARQKAGDPNAMLRLVRAQQSVLAAGGDLARVHDGLLDIARERGAVIHDCPPNESMEGAEEEESTNSSSLFLQIDRVRPLRPAAAPK